MKIIFEEAFLNSKILFDKPIPASQKIPSWYKSFPMTTNQRPPELSTEVNQNNLTIKACAPFLDSIVSGYIFTTPCDIQIKKEKNGEVFFNWLVGVDGLVSGHPKEQAPELMAPQSTINPMKWSPGWRVITPKGYSTLFVHPLNRIDLPFYTLSGVVETDSYGLPTEFPFVFQDKAMKSEEVLILEKGTPIIQAIPFKRNHWSSGYQQFSELNHAKENFLLRSNLFKSYKKQFWKKKTYS